MNEKILSFVRKLYNDQRGQVLPWLACGMIGFLGLSGLSIDVGRLYVAYDRLQAGTNAAALAAAGCSYNTSGCTVASQSLLYGSQTGKLNTSSSFSSVTTTSSTVCLNILMPKGYSCSTSSTPNAVKVVQTATVPMYIMKLLGVSSVSLRSTAQAAMQGVAGKWNVAVVVDSTASMSDSPDSSCSGYSTRFSCVMGGLQGLLGVTNPCAPGYATCATSNANVHVSIFTFPNMTTGTIADDYTCSGTPTKYGYTVPSATATSYTPVDGASYQVTSYLSDYYLSTASNGLNSTSNVTKAITGCMKNPGGEGSYMAGAMYAAQASLTAAQISYPGSNNAMIVLSDGAMGTTSADFDSKATLTTTGLYPSVKDQCQQAIMAGAAATAAGTRVYSVAYGSSGSGCTSAGGGTDTSLVATGTYNATVSLGTLTPCVTMEDIASSLQYFYADSSSTSCSDAAHSTSSLQNIFLSIAASITSPQLLPNNAT